MPSSTHGRNRFHPALADLTESPNEPRVQTRFGKAKTVEFPVRTSASALHMYRRTALRWHWGRGRARDLIELTPDGRHWYRRRTHREPAASELNWVMQMHVSARHALAILEARDYLRQMGLPTDDDPPPCPQSAEDPLGPRSEPDLVAYYQNRVFPVEVQREVGSRYLPKWEKSLDLYQRLMLITFSETSLRRQGTNLILARQRGQLPSGRILLASLERFENGFLTFSTL